MTPFLSRPLRTLAEAERQIAEDRQRAALLRRNAELGLTNWRPQVPREEDR